MTTTKVTLWKNKKSDLFAPATPDYVTTLENGDVDDKTEALGEETDDVKGVLENYKNIDRVLRDMGMENRFTKWLLPDYEPVLVEMTDEELTSWKSIFEDY